MPARSLHRRPWVLSGCYAFLGILTLACGENAGSGAGLQPAGGAAGSAGLGGQNAGGAGSPSAGAAGTGGTTTTGGVGGTSGGGAAGMGGSGGALTIEACHSTLPAASTMLAKPPMGWNSGGLGCDQVSEQAIEQAADALVSTGLRDKGYRYVVLQDCWQGARGGDGTLAVDAKFPSGLASLSKYLHDRQLLLGVGTSRGPQSCAGRAGSEGHEAADSQLWHAAGVDYVAVDDCSANPADDVRRTQFTSFISALGASSVPVAIEPYPDGQDIEGFQQWMASAAVYRNRGGISDSWDSFIANLDSNADGVAYTRAGSFNDPGVLELGGSGMQDAEYQAQLTLAAIMAAPLFTTANPSQASTTTLEMLGNPELIAVDQDALALSGYRVGMGGAYSGGTEIWSKPLSGCGERAVAFLNRKDTPASIPVTWFDLGLAPGSAKLRDLWAHADMPDASDQYAAQVPAHSAVLLKITGSELAAPSGVKQLSDLPWLYAANSVGPVERDLSNNERKAHDGTPLSIAGHHYDKGLGVHAASLVTYRLAGGCTSFTADVGVDDEATEIASVDFQVWADGQKLFDSGLMKGKMPGKSLSVDVTGKRELSLFVDNGGDDRHQDHVDWAGAQLTCK